MDYHFGASESTRREFLRRAAAAGLVALPAAGGLAACATSGSASGGNKPKTGKKTNKNPLGVDESAALNVAAFDGGFGYQYNKNDGSVYNKEFAKAKVNVQGLQELGKKLQPKFVGGNPPDVIDNSGAGNLDVASLIANGQIAELTDLYNAPAYDTPGKTVKDTLRPGVVESGEFNGKPYIMNYVYTVWGIWHSKTLFDQKGWDYPQTWDDMLKLCKKIKQSTSMAPWTYQGKYPAYIINAILTSAAKLGGNDVMKNIDNLEPNAWKQDAVKEAATAYHQLIAQDYVLKGTPGLTHIQSQTKWTQGQAVFIPCGTWLRNEARSTTPKNFDMVINPTPSLSTSDKMPFSAAWEGAGEGFIVPKQASNAQGGKEYLRIMLSKKQSQDFSNLVNAITSTDYTVGQGADTSVTSALAMTKAAGSNFFTWQFGTWYAKMETAVENATGSLMSPGGISVDEWIKRCQQAADDTSKDKTIKKYHR